MTISSMSATVYSVIGLTDSMIGSTCLSMGAMATTETF
jgi:hypothetical protein